MPRLWVQDLTFSDGSTVALSKNDIILIVGPNNAGKSATLRAIRDKLATRTHSNVVSNLTSFREGDAGEVADWLDSFTRKNDPFAQDPVFQAFGAGVHKSQIASWWAGQNPLQNLSRFFATC